MDTESIVKPERWAPLVPPIFVRCVDLENSRYALGAPFWQEGFLYATDGRICVRTPRPEGWPLEPSGRVPRNLGVTAFGGKHLAEPVLIPEVQGDCETCQGAGVLPERECRACDGSGEIECNCDCPRCDYTAECEECGATGLVGPGPCRDCRGSGVARGLDRLKLADGTWIRRAYAAMLRDFGASVYLPDNDEPNLPVRFTVGEVEGVLMPMTRPGPGETQE